jgi:O-antigen ligase
MISTTRLLSRVNPTAGAALAVILAGLLAEGANTPGAASLFAGVLVAAAFLAVALSPPAAVAHALRTNAATAAAAGAFIALAVLTTLPLPSPELAARFAHPDGARLGWSVPAISLAPSSTLEGVVIFLAPAAAFTLGALARTTGTRAQIAGWVCAVAIGLALYALQLFAAGISQGGGRLDAHLGSANAAAAAFGALSLIALASALDQTVSEKAHQSGPPMVRWLLAPVRAPLAAAAFALATACALLTQSRGGLAATGVAFAIFVGLLALRTRGRTRLLMLGPAAAFGAVAVFMLTLGADSVLGRLSDVGEALRGRQELLAPHWQAFLANPIWGNGLNTFHEINAMAADPENWDSLRFVGAAHNIYIQALEETGLIGLALFALMLAPPLWRALTRALQGSPSAHWNAALYAVGMLFLVHGVMDFALQVPAIAALFSFCLGAFGTPRPEV